MGQTIISELIAHWQEEGQPKDITVFGFESLLDVLEKSEEAMFELGASCNRQHARVIELEQALEQAREVIDSMKFVESGGYLYCVSCGVLQNIIGQERHLESCRAVEWMKEHKG